MSTIQEQIESIEEEIRKTPYHKGTEHYIGRLRAKISNLKDKEYSSKSKKGGGVSYAVKKQGDATVVLVGPPSVGKSTLINKLTNSKSKIAAYEFTTVTVIPGMMKYNDAFIQILDVPGLISGAEKGKGRGREVLSVVRSADLLLLITDLGKEEKFDEITNILEGNGIRINKTKPDVTIDKKLSGGLTIISNIKQDIDKETIKDVANEFGIKNAEITIKEKLTMDRLIDAFSKNRVYVPGIYIVNKTDLSKIQSSNDNFIYISAKLSTNLENLKDLIWQNLNLVRIYLIKKDEKPHINSPLIVKRNITLRDVTEKIGEDFSKDITKAIIWGKHAKYSGQEVSLKTKVKDDIQIRFV